MGAKLVGEGITKMIRAIIVCIAFIASVGCTWQDAAKVTANSLVYSAMVVSGSGGPYNLHADLAGQAAGDFADLAFNCTE